MQPWILGRAPREVRGVKRSGVRWEPFGALARIQGQLHSPCFQVNPVPTPGFGMTAFSQSHVWHPDLELAQ
jgi:hypothetical protein